MEGWMEVGTLLLGREGGRERVRVGWMDGWTKLTRNQKYWYAGRYAGR
jgi:hypothetical protein